MFKVFRACLLIHPWRVNVVNASSLTSKYSQYRTILNLASKLSAVGSSTNGISGKAGKVNDGRKISGGPNELNKVDDFKARYMRDVFLNKTEGGGHVIFASDDGINPLLSEIRFAADAVYYNYPYVWFRDHCRCAECVDGKMRSKVAVENLDPSIEPDLDQTSTLGSAVGILWKDGHFSKYPERWLWAHRFESQPSRDILDSSHCIRWDANEISKSLKRFDFKELLSDDESLFKWLLEVRVRGLAIIQHVPETPHQLEKLAQRVGFLRRFSFGCIVKEMIKFDTHKEGGLSLETDLPYLSSPPGVHLLHCMNQEGSTRNGEVKISFSDGFYASDLLKEEEPHSSEILSKMEWEYFDVGEESDGEHHYRSRHPTIRFDSQGQVSQVIFNDRMRGPGLSVPANFVSPAYGSLKKFVSILSRPGNVYEHSLQPGEIIARDNSRVLQRWAPVESSEFESQVEGAYLDWDEISSKVRVLFHKL